MFLVGGVDHWNWSRSIDKSLIFTLFVSKMTLEILANISKAEQSQKLIITIRVVWSGESPDREKERREKERVKQHGCNFSYLKIRPSEPFIAVGGLDM